MIQRHKNENNLKPKIKNSIMPLNNIVVNQLINSQNFSKSNSNQLENKFALKRIKNNSIPNYRNKTKGKKDNNKKKLTLRNINNLNKKNNTTTISNNNKILNKIKNAKTQDNKFNVCKLNKILQNTNLKETIIIDNEGNNNLNLLMKKNKDNKEKKEKNKKDLKIDKIKEELNDDNINSDYTSLFMETSIDKKLINNDFYVKPIVNKNYNTINNTTNKKKNLDRAIKKNQIKSQGKDNKRLNEYIQLFQLLNDNIEQFKSILKDKKNNLNKNKKNNNIKLDHDKQGNYSCKINFFSSRENSSNKVQNLKTIKSNDKLNKIINFNKIHKNKNTKSPPIHNLNIQKNNYKLNKNILDDFNSNNSINISKDKNNSKIYSFLESFTQDDLFLPLNSNHQKKSSRSLTKIFQAEKKEENTIINNTNTKIIKKEIISSNEMSTNKCDEEEINIEILGTDEHIKYDKLKNRNINPHFFSNDFVNNINNEKQEKVNIIKECYIF